MSRTEFAIAYGGAKPMIRRFRTDDKFDGDRSVPPLPADGDALDADSQGNNNVRHHNPETGRWLNMGPIGYQAGDANLDRYPVNTASTDPKT